MDCPWSRLINHVSSTTRRSTVMTGNLRHRRWAWLLVALLMVTAVALAPRFGFPSTTPTPLWNDRPLPLAPAPLQVPNWVELAKQLKPADVNVNTKRLEEAMPQLKGPIGR